MEYSIREFADLAGITTRALRYYDKIGLLKPDRVSASGYRVYTGRQVDALQLILLYKSFGMALRDIIDVMHAPDFDRAQALRRQLEALTAKRRELDVLIDNITRTLQCEEGEGTMTDREKFEGLKRALVEGNEQKYGAEIREEFGDEIVGQSNARMMNLTQEQYDEMQQLSAEILTLLERAVTDGAAPQSEQGREIAELHKKWLGYTWPSYSTEAHKGLGETYIADDRFKAYYDGNVEGCARFLCDAIQAHM